MKLLLDTHTFIWWDGEPRCLSRRAAAAIASPANQVLLSIASLWEMQIKIALHRLKLRKPLERIVEAQCSENALEILSIELPHLWRYNHLPALHGDPFDRMLVAQAQAEGAKLVTRDKVFSGYPVEVLW